MSDKHPIVYVAIGSNIEPERHLQAALNLLKQVCTVLAVSPVFQSPAFGFENQPDFLDIVVKLTTTQQPAEFKTDVLDVIERQLGRDRNAQVNKYGPLTVDLDILLWGHDVLSFDDKPWRVPDDSILKFGAVAIPLAYLAGDLLHPTEGISLQEIANRFDANEIRLRSDLKIE